MNNRDVKNVKKYKRSNRLTKAQSKTTLYSTGIYLKYQQMSRLDALEFAARNKLIYPKGMSEEKAQEDFLTIVHYNDDFKKRNYVKKGKKNNKTYMNIYAHRLSFMVPKRCTKSSSEYLYAFMEEYLSLYPDLLWMGQVYQYNSIKMIDIMILTRQILKEPICRSEVYTSDYYWNKKTQRRASYKEAEACTDGSIVQRHKKGEKKRDADGNFIARKVTCASKEVPLFKYIRRNEHTNIGGFEIMVEHIKSIFAGTVNKLDLGIERAFRFVKKVTYKPGKYKQSTLLKITMRNRLITRVNTLLTYIQLSLLQAGFLDEKKISRLWYKLISKLTKICTEEEVKYAGCTQYINYKGHLGTFKEKIVFVESAATEAFKEFYHEVDKQLCIWGVISKVPKEYDIVL